MSQASVGKSILVAGSTGLVGRECVDMLIGTPAFTRIVALVRRPLLKAVESERLKVEPVDFNRLAEKPELFGVDIILCALGTTMRQAGSEAAFRTVDYDYPLAIAQTGLARGARHFMLVSSAGADPGSRFFYMRVKGELEAAVSEIGYRSLTIIRPSFIIGDRVERRPWEPLLQRLGVLAPAGLRPVRATAVAASLVRAAAADAPGKTIIENRNIR